MRIKEDYFDNETWNNDDDNEKYDNDKWWWQWWLLRWQYYLDNIHMFEFRYRFKWQIYLHHIIHGYIGYTGLPLEGIFHVGGLPS